MRHDHMEQAEDEIKDILVGFSFKEATTIIGVLLGELVTAQPTTRKAVQELYSSLANAACTLVQRPPLH